MMIRLTWNSKRGPRYCPPILRRYFRIFSNISSLKYSMKLIFWSFKNISMMCLLGCHHLTPNRTQWSKFCWYIFLSTRNRSYQKIVEHNRYIEFYASCYATWRSFASVLTFSPPLETPCKIDPLILYYWKSVRLAL